VAYDPVYGARPLRRYLQQHVETPLARMIIAGELHDGGQVRIGLDSDKLVFNLL
jgi:ATP-dependent Clp protease ATP-binding subunit ClpB